MKMRGSVLFLVILLIIAMSISVACSRGLSDSQITSQIQDKLNSDSGLQGKQLGVQASNGVVTLSGAVDNDVERDAAARYASAIPGVKEVVNNLQVAPMALPVAQEPAPESPPRPAPKSAPKRPAAVKQAAAHPDGGGTPMAMAATAQQNTIAPPASAAPVTPPPPPPPQKVTIPAGTTLAVRLVDTIDSEKSQQGETFHATLNSPLAVEGEVAIPTGYDVEGHVVEVKSAGKFAGQSLVVLQLDRISVGSKSYSIQTDQYKREGSSRGKNTAEKVGAGAAIGAIIGGIAGGGKGAAIGAAAGGGVGGGVQAATKGQQIKLPSETVLNFTLQSPLTVIPAQSADSNRHKMSVSDNSNQ